MNTVSSVLKIIRSAQLNMLSMIFITLPPCYKVDVDIAVSTIDLFYTFVLYHL